MQDALRRAEPLRASDRADRADSAAYGQSERLQARQERPGAQGRDRTALQHAADVPLRTARAALGVLELARSSPRSATSTPRRTLGAALMSRAAARASRLNVRINAAQITDASARDALGGLDVRGEELAGGVALGGAAGGDLRSAEC
jgi:hypothetical protein